MTDEQFKELQESFVTVRDNQRVINQNMAAFQKAVTDRLDSLESDIRASLSNDQVAESYFLKLQEDLRRIKTMLNK